MNKTDRKKLFHLLRCAARFETHLYQLNERRTYGYLVRNFWWLFQGIPFVVAVGMAIARKFFGAPEIFGLVGLICLLFSYLAMLIHPFLLAWINRQKLMEALTNPLSPLLRNANVTATVDARVIPRLLQSPIDHLELLSLELKAEKEFFERRISLVIGSIEKIGLGPGLLAAGVSLSNLKEGQSGWITALAYATPVLYIFGFAAHFQLMRLDRFVKVVELAVSRKKSLKI